MRTIQGTMKIAFELPLVYFSTQLRVSEWMSEWVSVLAEFNRAIDFYLIAQVSFYLWYDNTTQSITHRQ